MQSLKELKSKIDSLEMTKVRIETQLEQKKSELASTKKVLLDMGVDLKNAKAFMEELKSAIEKNEKELSDKISEILKSTNVN